MTEIPKTFHFIWLGESLPEKMEGYINSWRERHDSWTFNIWRDSDIPQLFNQDLFDAAESIAPGSAEQFRTDIARYEILWEYGGVYVDCDMECKKSIDDLLRLCDCFVAWEVSGRWANNAIMGAHERHPFVADLIEDLPASVEARQPRDRPNRFSGPQFLTKVLKQHKEVTVFPKSWFYPYAHNELHRGDEDFPYAYAVHHWNNQRRLHGTA